MTITFNSVTIAQDGVDRSGVSALRGRSEGAVQETPGVDLAEPYIEGRGNLKRTFTFSSKMQFDTPEDAAAHFLAVLDLPGTSATLDIDGTEFWAACRTADSEPQGCRVLTTYEFITGAQPA